MNVSMPACDDASFGPVVTGCRQDFDFTLAFEQYIFSIVPSAILLCAAPLRILTLRRQVAKVRGDVLKYAKLVSLVIRVPFGIPFPVRRWTLLTYFRAQSLRSPVSNWPCWFSGPCGKISKGNAALRWSQHASR